MKTRSIALASLALFALVFPAKAQTRFENIEAALQTAGKKWNTPGEVVLQISGLNDSPFKSDGSLTWSEDIGFRKGGWTFGANMQMFTPELRGGKKVRENDPLPFSLRILGTVGVESHPDGHDSSGVGVFAGAQGLPNLGQAIQWWWHGIKGVSKTPWNLNPADTRFIAGFTGFHRGEVSHTSLGTWEARVALLGQAAIGVETGVARADLLVAIQPEGSPRMANPSLRGFTTDTSQGTGIQIGPFFEIAHRDPAMGGGEKKKRPHEQTVRWGINAQAASEWKGLRVGISTELGQSLYQEAKPVGRFAGFPEATARVFTSYRW